MEHARVLRAAGVVTQTLQTSQRKSSSPSLVRYPISVTSPIPTSATAAGLPHKDLLAAIPRLRRYARVLTGDSTRADDLVQDTLARAWEKRRLWREGSDLRAWLFTIMHNVHVNQVALARRDSGNVSLDDDSGSVAWQPPVRANQLDRVELMEIVEQMAHLS